MKKLSLIIVVIFAISFATNAQKKGGGENVLPKEVKQLAQTYMDILHTSSNLAELAIRFAKIAIPDKLNEDGTLTTHASNYLVRNYKLRESYPKTIQIDRVYVTSNSSYVGPADYYHIDINNLDGKSNGSINIIVPKTGVKRTPKVAHVHFK